MKTRFFRIEADGSRTEFWPPKRKGPRPRLCSVCHVEATWALVAVEVHARLSRRGHLERYLSERHEFRCDNHVDAK